MRNGTSSELSFVNINGYDYERELYKRKQERKRRKIKQIRRRKRIKRMLLFCAAALCIMIFWIGRNALRRGIEFSEEKIAEAQAPKEDEYPESLIRLYAKHEEARGFVLDYNKNKDKHETIDVSGAEKQDGIPRFIQWDEQWGYESYGNDFLAVTGCGPTALSMVYVGLTGDESLNPLAMAELAEKEGYCVEGSGSSWSMMTELAGQIGLSSYELTFDEDHIRSALSEGNPIICIMGPGDFTTGGHFIVLTGMDENGGIHVNDPNSNINSEKSWELEKLMPQIRDLWVFEH